MRDGGAAVSGVRATPHNSGAAVSGVRVTPCDDGAVASRRWWVGGAGQWGGAGRGGVVRWRAAAAAVAVAVCVLYCRYRLELN
jgi:hypothetical protein